MTTLENKFSIITNSGTCYTLAIGLNPVNVPHEKISLKLMAIFLVQTYLLLSCG